MRAMPWWPQPLARKLSGAPRKQNAAKRCAQARPFKGFDFSRFKAGASRRPPSKSKAAGRASKIISNAKERAKAPRVPCGLKRPYAASGAAAGARAWAAKKKGQYLAHDGRGASTISRWIPRFLRTLRRAEESDPVLVVSVSGDPSTACPVCDEGGLLLGGETRPGAEKLT